MSYKKEMWSAADVRCPFYISNDQDSHSIKCEGYCDGASLVTRFRKLKDRENHMGNYCVGKFQNCPVFGFVYGEKYDD